MEKDDLLISKILSGDTEAFSVLVESYQNKVYGFLYKMTHSKEETEDLLQEVFMRVYNYLYKYDSKYCFSTWLYKIAFNTFKTLYKNKKKQPLKIFIEDISLKTNNHDHYPEEFLMKKEQYKEVISLVETLNIEQKTVFVLRHFNEFSFKVIGDIIGITENAARMKYFRAKENLAREFEIRKKKGVRL